jgi:hypothetical protein
MNKSIPFLLIACLWILGCSNNEKCNYQLNSQSCMSKSSKSEISMESYFPSPHVNVNLEDEILQALQSKFEYSSDIEITILDKDRASESKPMYYVWFKVTFQQNIPEKGLALVTVGISPEVITYYQESMVLDALKQGKPLVDIPKNILEEVKVSLKM